MIQAHSIYCALYFCYYDVSSTSGTRSWRRGPLLYSPTFDGRHQEEAGGWEVLMAGFLLLLVDPLLGHCGLVASPPNAKS